MTQTVALAKLRGVLDEVSALFWTDAILYYYLDAGQTQVIQTLLRIEEITRKTDKKFRHPDLVPLITAADIVFVSTTVGYALPTYWLRTLSVEATYASVPANGGTQVWATEITLEELGHRRANTYSIPTTSDPVYWIATIPTTGKAISFFPTPNYSATVTGGHKYYKIPTAVGSGQVFTLKEHLHEACVEYALFMAFEQDGETQQAQLHLQNFLGMIK